MRSDGSGWVFSDLDTVLDQLEIGVHEAHAGVVGLCAANKWWLGYHNWIAQGCNIDNSIY